MSETLSHRNRIETNILGEMCKSPGMDKETERISCIWCYLAKEGAKKAYSGIRKLRASRVRDLRG